VNHNIKLRVKAISWETELVKAVELRSLDGSELPKFTAGSHVDLHLPIGLVRSYSLLNPQRERHRYVVGIARDRDSRGGSRYIHDDLKVGDVLPVTPPRNLFPIDETAETSVLIGGGIGITPIISMVQRLDELGRNWRLYCAARSRKDAPFIDRLVVYGDSVSFHFDNEAAGLLDVESIVAGAPAGAHLYCCGPTLMLSTFTAAARKRDPGCIHIERFSPADDAATDGGFLVELARTGRTLAVPKGSTILETLRNAGISPLCSCQQGICGSCETRVIAGEPDHRDAVLTADERKSNETMMICCSGSRSKKLVLDL
jgi:vanillate O-demethylase ferredoxin subunit